MEVRATGLEIHAGSEIRRLHIHLTLEVDLEKATVIPRWDYGACKRSHCHGQDAEH